MAQAYGDISATDAGDRLLLQLASLFAGVGLICAAVGIWVVAGSGVSIWIKLLLSFSFLLAGMLALAPPKAPCRLRREPVAIVYDEATGELCITEQMRNGQEHVSARIALERVGKMDVQASSFVAWARDGEVLARVQLHSRATERRVRSLLRAL